MQIPNPSNCGEVQSPLRKLLAVSLPPLPPSSQPVPPPHSNPSPTLPFRHLWLSPGRQADEERVEAPSAVSEQAGSKLTPLGPGSLLSLSTREGRAPPPGHRPVLSWEAQG